jgi:lipopolysaccharide/colanic/teichoic acid biosynthesis glycosyltransferase
MSLVGPRPELVSIVAKYEPWQHRRHAVKPGITGLWQVSERGSRMLHEATEIDIEYLDHLSALSDLSILARTPLVMLGMRTGI